ncbi:DUF1490 family protein [Mycobacterium tuberculosis]|uniref:DUF1490 family protein n=1 Tax=Mycobacterium tuberculosis TaxID=1773 RepID=UPI00019015D2|nr:conserved hypothetical protein [Mycobacterium tuberculosis T92]
MVTGAVGVAAYEALRKMVVKAPLRAATVSVDRGARRARLSANSVGGDLVLARAR